MIAWAQLHPDWALGFGDEVWWSRVAQPTARAWQAPDQPMRLVEQTVPPHDPDPKALACYGLLVRRAQAPEEVWLRFVEGRPVSAITTQFLEWCCTKLAALSVPVWLLVWDNAAWHVSQAVRGDTPSQPAGQAGAERGAHPPLLSADQESLAQSD